MLVQDPVSEASGSCMFRAEAKGGSSTGGRRKGWGHHSWALIKGVCWIKEGKGILCRRFSSGKWGGEVDCCQVEDRTGEGASQGVEGKLVLPLLSDHVHLPSHRCTHPAQVMTTAGIPPPTHLPRPPAAPTRHPSTWQVYGGSTKMAGTGPRPLCQLILLSPPFCRWQLAPLS